MKTENIQKGTAALWLGTSLITGATALVAHNEAVKDETKAAIFQAQGDPRASEWHLYADEQESKLNLYSGLTSLVLALFAINSVIIAKNPKKKSNPKHS